MQHAGLQYGQGAAHSHQSPPFAHAADISSNNGGNSTSNLRQFRKRDGLDPLTSSAKTPGDLLASGGAGGVSAENIARVRPHNHYPAGPNDYYRYHHQHHQQYSDFGSAPAFAKEAPPPPTVKYSEIAEAPVSAQHTDHLATPSHPPSSSKLKDKDYIEMCNIPQMKQQYTYHSDPHPQYLHKPPPESQYYHHPPHHPPQYKYTNHQYQTSKYPENDFLAQLQRLRPKMARSIMNDHIREAQNAAAYPNYGGHHVQNQRYYSHLQSTGGGAAPPPPPSSYQNAYHSIPQAAGYYQAPGTNSCSYSARAAPPTVSPRVRSYAELPYAPQKVSPSYNGAQYQQPEYAQHYQHRRAAPPQEYYQQQCRSESAFEASDTRSASSSGLRHFLENWAPEEESAAPAPAPAQNTNEQIATIYKERNESEQQQQPVYVINSSDLPLENVSLVATENGQYILKNNGESSVVRLKEGEMSGGERTVNLQIVDTPCSKPSDCLLATKATEAAPPPVAPPTQTVHEDSPSLSLPETSPNQEEKSEEEDEEKEIKDMPSLLDPTEDKKEEKESESESAQIAEMEMSGGEEERAKRTHQRIFSVDDIINNIGSSQPKTTPPLSLQETSPSPSPSLSPKPDEETVEEEVQYQNAISVEDDCVILEIGGALVQLNINNVNGTKVLSVVALSESLVIDVNGNYEGEKHSEREKNNEREIVEEEEEVGEEKEEEEIVAAAAAPAEEEEEESFEESLIAIGEVDASEVVIGEELVPENEVSLDLDQLQHVCDNSVQSVPLNDENEAKPNTGEDVRVEKEEEEGEVSAHEEDLDEIPVNVSESDVKTSEQCQKTEKCAENNGSEVRLDPEEAKKSEVRLELEEAKKSEVRVKHRRENEESVIKLSCRKSVDEENVPKLSSRRNSEVRVKLEREKEESVVRIASSKRNSDSKIKSETENAETVLKFVSSKRNNDSKTTKSEKVEVLPRKSKSERDTTIEVKLKTEKLEETIAKLPSRRRSSDSKLSSKKIPENPKPKNEETSISKLPSRKSVESKTKNERESEENVPSRRSSEPKTKHSEEKPPRRRESEVKTKSERETTTKTETESGAKKQPIRITTDEKKSLQVCTKAAKKLYETKTKPQKLSKLEETVNKIKSLKEKTFSSSSSSSNLESHSAITTTTTTTTQSIKKPSIMSPLATPTSLKTKRVTWSNRDASEFDRASRRLSWEEYSSRKRKRKVSTCSSSDDSSTHTKIADNTVTSSNDDVIEQVEISIDSAIKEKISVGKISSPTTSTTTNVTAPKLTDWEEDDEEELRRRPLPEKPELISKPSALKIAPIIDVSEFRIPPLLPPASSSAEDDISLQTYKNVVDSKLNSLNITIPKKINKVKQPLQQSSSSSSSIDKQLGVSLIERFLNKSSLDCDELEKVRKIIEFKRKLQREASANKYEVNTNQLKMHIRKMPSEKRKRFRNLYGDEEEEEEEKVSEEGDVEEEGEEDEEDDDSSSKSSERSAVDDYSVYQRDSQGVPKLIFKRKFGGFPQPFVKLERSQAAEMLAKKRKLY